MKCTTRAMPTAGPRRRQPSWHEEASDHHFTNHDIESFSPQEHDRVLAILAMGGDGVSPTLVRRAIDECWTVEEAARAFRHVA